MLVFINVSCFLYQHLPSFNLFFFNSGEVVLSVNNKITAEVELSVRRPPIISDNSTQSIVASEGQAVQMECYAAGYPTPTIIWRRENNALLPTGELI